MKLTPRSRWINVLARFGITLAGIGLVALLRPDLRTYVWQDVRGVYLRYVTSPRLIQKYLRDHTSRRLEIGAGANRKIDWLSTDIEPTEDVAYMDASKRFPFADGSFHYVSSEHLIEHLTYEQGLEMLRECHRVLAPGGKLRIATPNLLRFLELFDTAKSVQAQEYIQGKIAWHEVPWTPEPETYLLNLEMRAWGHQFIYTPSMLRASLETLGFKDISEFRPGESADPVLRGVEVRAKGGTREINAFETMVFQAIR